MLTKSQQIQIFSDAQIGIVDLSMLLIMWVLVFATSIWNIGIGPGVVFIILNILLVIRNSSNGLLVLLLILFSPAIALGTPLGPFAIATAITFFVYIFKDLVRGTKQIRFNLVFITAAIFVFYLALTVFYTADQKMAIYYLKKYFEGLIVLFLLFSTVQTKEDLGRILKWWAIVAGLMMLIKLVHFQLDGNTALFKAVKAMEALDSETAYELQKKLTFNIKGSIIRRFLLPGEEPNYVSAGLIFPFAVSLAFYSVGRFMEKFFWSIIACMIAVLVIGTYSRSGFLVIGAVLAMYFLKNNLRAAIPSAFLFGAFYILVTKIPELHERIFGISGAIQKGAAGRFDLWNTALRMWLDAPLMGNGFASFYYKVHTAAHNTYMQLLAETGLVGLVLFIIIIIVSVWTCFRLGKLYSDKKHRDVMFSRIGLFGVLGASLMIGTVTYQDIKLFWLSCGGCALMYFVTKDELRIQRMKDKMVGDKIVE